MNHPAKIMMKILLSLELRHIVQWIATLLYS